LTLWYVKLTQEKEKSEYKLWEEGQTQMAAGLGGGRKKKRHKEKKRMDKKRKKTTKRPPTV
jgi:hypothetical protein